MSLEKRAAELASAHRPLRRPPAGAVPLLEPRVVAVSIARATQGFRTPRPEDPQHQKAAEWFLDNHYLVTRALRQIATEMPRGFRRRLPYVGEQSVPRVLSIAHAFVEATALDFDEATLVSFIEAYQTEASLTIAELWALPAMLRIATIEPLVRTLDTFFAPLRSKKKAWEGLSSNLVVERAVRALRLLAEVDWRPFVQRTSAVEAALRDDPSGTYVRMEFEARDVYRKEVESLAWDTGKQELEVARIAVALAAEGLAAGGDPREAHVGYYLVDRGQAQLKQDLEDAIKAVKVITAYLGQAHA